MKRLSAELSRRLGPGEALSMQLEVRGGATVMHWAGSWR